MDSVALYLQDDFTMQEAIGHVRYAEARGFDAVWQGETRFVRDSMVAVAAYATVTSRIKIGMGVANIFTRHATALASSLVTMDDVAPDRILCGLGAWDDYHAQMAGINRGKHMLAMREVVNAVRALLRLEPVTFRGEFITLNNLQIDVRNGRTDPRRIPIYVGATGPKMLALAGDIADGVLLNYMVSPRYNDMALQQLETGLQQSGRTLYDIDRPQLIMCSVDSNREVALQAARTVVLQYILHQPQLMRANGVPGQLIEDVGQLQPRQAEELAQVARMIPDDVVQLVTASGTPSEVRAKVREYVRAGASSPVLYPLNGKVRDLIDAFASGYSA
ncbi:MAG: LLM class flavin-dependent oxidoreductase [Chloroflexota bacterium]